MAYLTNIGGTQLTSIGEGNLTTLAGPDQFNITNNIEIPFRYAYEFTNEGGIKYWVGITNKRYVGATSTLSPTSLGFSLQYNGPTNEHYQPIISTEATFELIYDATAAEMVADMIDSVPTEYIAFIYKWNTSTELYDIWWRGIVNTETLQTPDASTTNPHGTVTITADDGFGYLENVLYTPVDTDTEKSALHWFYQAIFSIYGNTTIDITEFFLMSCMVWYDDNQNNDFDTHDPLYDTFISVANFQTIDDFGNVQGMNYRDILTNILNSFFLTMYQCEGRYVLISPTSYADSNVRGCLYYYHDPTPFVLRVDDLFTALKPLPDRFGPAGIFGNIVKYGRVNAKYAYKTSIYGGTLLPNPLTPNPIVDNTFTPIVHTMCETDASKLFRIEGSINTVVTHSGGLHNTELWIATAFEIKCNGQYLKRTYLGQDVFEWSATPEIVRFYSERFYPTYLYTSIDTNINIVFRLIEGTTQPITLETKYTRIQEAAYYIDDEWVDTVGHTLTWTSTFQNDWKATIGNDGEMEGELGYYAEVSDSGSIQIDLEDGNIGDGPSTFNLSDLKVLDSTDTLVPSTLWTGADTSAASLVLHKVRCREYLAWARATQKTYEGSFFGELKFLDMFYFNEQSWIWLAGTYYANDNRYDGTLIELGISYSDITTGSDGVANPNSSGGSSGATTPEFNNYWQRNNTTLSPVTDGDDVQTSGTVSSYTSSTIYASLLDSTLELRGALSQHHIIADNDSENDEIIFNRKVFNAALDAAVEEIVTAAGDWDASNNGATYELKVTPENAETTVSRFKVDKEGNVLLNTDCKIETDGTLVFLNDATVYNDINTAIIPRNVGTGTPTRATFIGNLKEYTFAVNDYAELGAVELLHDWMEGTAVEIHVHWATNGTNDTTVRGVKWEIEYSWANMQSAGGTVVFGTPDVQSAETSIASGEVSLTHKYTSIYSFTPTGGKIGAQVSLRLKRIASVTNTAPAANPFVLGVGLHYQIDTLGSRSTSSK